MFQNMNSFGRIKTNTGSSQTFTISQLHTMTTATKLNGYMVARLSRILGVEVISQVEIREIVEFCDPLDMRITIKAEMSMGAIKNFANIMDNGQIYAVKGAFLETMKEKENYLQIDEYGEIAKWELQAQSTFSQSESIISYTKSELSHDLSRLKPDYQSKEKDILKKYLLKKQMNSGSETSQTTQSNVESSQQ